MRMFTIVLTITMNLVVGTAALGQIADWRSLFRELVSPDPAVRDAARERASKTLFPKLDYADPHTLDKELPAILETFNDEEPVRLQASAVLAAWALGRPDGTEALKRAIPVLLSQFKDRNERVRENAILAIANLRPQVPTEALPSLLAVVRDDEGRSEELSATRAAIYGVARLAGKSSTAVRELVNVLSAGRPVEIRRAAIFWIGQARVADPAVVAKLGEILGDRDRDLTGETIRAVSRIGRPAEALRPILQRIADTELDTELASAAAAAISRLEK